MTGTATPLGARLPLSSSASAAARAAATAVSSRTPLQDTPSAPSDNAGWISWAPRNSTL